MTGDAPIVIERIYSAQPRDLWDLWATRDGFASWWGPQGFRADVHEFDPREGGRIVYDMAADTPEMVAAMAELGRPPSHETRGWFAEFTPHSRLVLAHMIDFLPGVATYESTITVEFTELSPGRTRMRVISSPMHDRETSLMQREGFTSQLSKLDARFGWTG